MKSIRCSRFQPLFGLAGTGRSAAIIACGQILLLLSACSSLQTDLDVPAVAVNYIKPLPSDTLAPRFEIGLRITNPNDVPLKVKGAAYSVSLDGYEILNGVSNNIPTIDEYGTGDITIEAQTDLIVGMQFFNHIAKNRSDSFSYELSAKLSVDGFFSPIRINDTGTISLQP